MQTLQEKLYQTNDFLLGVEMVSIRESMGGERALKARTFASELSNSQLIDWVSITDNAGGNPQMAPHALGKPILYSGKEVVIHMSCKDLNRNGLESQAWFLNSEGFNNILALTGDYPVAGNEGVAKPVFDIDSIGLISMLNKMNQGYDTNQFGNSKETQRLKKTQFLIGAVTTNYKLYEGEVIPQYMKLQKKVECGAQFIINQVGFDSRKIHELKLYMDNHSMQHIPLIGNVYLLNPKVAKIFHSGKIPGVVVSPNLLKVCETQKRSEDKGKEFFYEFAAKQIAIYKGLGYRGVYLGGISNLSVIEKIMEIVQTFSVNDWKQFAKGIRFSRDDEFFYYDEDQETGLANPAALNKISKLKSNHKSFFYQFSSWMHNNFFEPDTAFAKIGTKICKNSKDPFQGPKVLRTFEQISKVTLYDCKDCGDCSLPDITFLCPESQCAKNQRNGPCGGTREGRCEVDGFGDCIWLRAYERLKYTGQENHLLDHVPVIQNNKLRRTSVWANHWLGRDHSSKQNNKESGKSKSNN
jgi:methylenetetrahydrofolate reductase (NADH)